MYVLAQVIKINRYCIELNIFNENHPYFQGLDSCIFALKKKENYWGFPVFCKVGYLRSILSINGGYYAIELVFL
jgi:hypothetical protein